MMMILIFSFSAQDATRSSGLSGGICGQIVRAVQKLFGLDLSRAEIEQWSQWLEAPVRKLAHFTEYAVFSFVTCIHGLMLRPSAAMACRVRARTAVKLRIESLARVLPHCFLRRFPFVFCMR